MKTKIRPANPADVPALFHIRTSVRENHLSREQLAGLGITEASIAEMISAAPCAWVAVSGDEVVGFSMIDIAEGSLFAAFILPSHEGMGIGQSWWMPLRTSCFGTILKSGSKPLKIAAPRVLPAPWLEQRDQG